MNAPPLATILSDFGTRDGFVGIVKGVILGHCPQARLVDLSHEVAPQDVLGGALVLASAVPHFPPGTVHLAVVDPGVGSERRPILIETERFSLIGPDNGLLSLAAERAPLRSVRHLDRPELFLESPGGTFHARDVFAPVLGRLLAGLSAEQVGSPIDEFQKLQIPPPRRAGVVLEGQIIHVDRFGNLICNIQRCDVGGFREGNLSVTIAGVRIVGLSTHYAAVREGKPLVLWNSWDRLEIAVRNDSAARHLRARAGDRVKLQEAGQ